MNHMKGIKSMNKSEIAEPQQFTKRPITVTALQFSEDGSNWAQVHAFMGRQCPLNVPTFYAEVHTLEGMLMAKRGWWIIRGIEGEFYPCEPRIFAKTYERGERAIAESQAWISVEEKLPETGQTVLVYFANLGLNAYIDVWPYDNMNQYFRKGKASLSPNEDVTHWMPLPDPPKGNENV